MGNLKADRFQPLKNFHCRLFPDRDATDRWVARAEELASLGYDISIDTTVVKTSGEKHDIADLILRSLGILTPKNCCPADGDKNIKSINVDSDNKDTFIEDSGNEIMFNKGSINEDKFIKHKSINKTLGTDSQISEYDKWDRENPEPSERNSPEWNDWLVRRICRNKP